MEPNSPEAIAGAWDDLCGSYLADLGRTSGRRCLAATEMAVIRKELAGRRSLRVLDAGCGPGWHAVQLAREDYTVVMADLSPTMLDAARTAAEVAGVQARVTVCRGDVRHLPLETRSFDAIVSCGTVVSDCGAADAALAEFARLLKDEGVALLSVRGLWASLERERLGCRAADARRWIEEGRRLVRQGHQAFDWEFFTVPGLAEVCLKAGLVLQRVYPVGVFPPPENEDGMAAYVQFHVELVDDRAALARAHELFAVAGRASAG